MNSKPPQARSGKAIQAIIFLLAIAVALVALALSFIFPTRPLQALPTDPIIPPTPGQEEGEGQPPFDSKTLLPDFGNGEELRAILKNAIKAGDEDLAIAAIDKLIESDQDPAPGDRYLQHNAVKFNRIRTIEHLLRRGIVLNARDDQGRLPLHTAAEMNNIVLIQAIVDLGGVGVNAKSDLDRSTPLHVAAATNSPDAVTKLLTLGADVDAITSGGMSPLHAAAAVGNIAIAKILIRNGAEISLKYKGRDAAQRAQINGYKKLADYLKSLTP